MHRTARRAAADRANRSSRPAVEPNVPRGSSIRRFDRSAVEPADEADFGDNQTSLAIPLRLIRGLYKIKKEIIMKQSLRITAYTGWLIPFFVAASFMGFWITDIVIPTLKGGNFNELYDFYGIRYLDITLTATVIGFIWMSLVVVRLAQQVIVKITV